MAGMAEIETAPETPTVLLIVTVPETWAAPETLTVPLTTAETLTPGFTATTRPNVPAAGTPEVATMGVVAETEPSTSLIS
jgi:hypothetical protein